MWHVFVNFSTCKTKALIRDDLTHKQITICILGLGLKSHKKKLSKKKCTSEKNILNPWLQICERQY